MIFGCVGSEHMSYDRTIAGSPGQIEPINGDGR